MEGRKVRIGWLLGWAVPENWFATLARDALPAASHVFVKPSPGAIDQLETSAPIDWVVGYSLGTLLLMGCALRAERLGRVALLAPIFAFPKEEGLGGRIPRAEVQILARRLRQDPDRAIREFYRRAGLETSGTGPLAVQSERGHSLAWGLAQLETVRVDPALPDGWVGWCGEDDPLLDADRLHELAGEIIPLPGVTHHPRALIRVFSKYVENAPSRKADAK
jgi:hypothetical protein